jgi:hypothetical protein
MPLQSNAAESWYNDPVSAEVVPIPHSLDLLPPESLTISLFRSLGRNLRDFFAPAKLPPLHLTSHPVDVGMLLGDRLRLPWFRTVFTNLGDVISPETLPPLELESRPVDVGELITDQLSHFWWASLLRNLADRVAPEKLPSLDLTAKPIDDVVPRSWLLLPLWSEVISTPKVFYPDKPKVAEASRPVSMSVTPPPPLAPPPPDPAAASLLRDIRRSRIRQRIWVTLATAQVVYLVVLAFWH